MKPISEYSSVGEWKVDTDKEGILTGTQVCWGLSNTMKKYNMKFPEAYEYLMKEGKLTLIGKIYVIDLSTTRP